MEEGILLVVALIFGIFAFVFARKSQKAEVPEKLGSDLAIDTVGETIQQTFEEEIDRVTSALNEANTAAQLAALGNARKRPPEE